MTARPEPRHRTRMMGLPPMGALPAKALPGELRGVLATAGSVRPPGRRNPDKDPGLWLLESPALGLLDPMVIAAQRIPVAVVHRATCAIYTRIGADKLGGGHGAPTSWRTWRSGPRRVGGWTVIYRLSITTSECPGRTRTPPPSDCVMSLISDVMG